MIALIFVDEMFIRLKEADLVKGAEHDGDDE